jgi:outer membrane cobalamin receptor
MLALFCLVSISAYGQTTVRLSGHVYDGADGRALAGAVVAIDGTDYRAVSDQFGYFEFHNTPPGSYRLRVWAEGYLVWRSEEINIVSDIPARLEVELRPDFYRLDDRRVVSRRPDIAPAANVTVLERSAIQSSQDNDLISVLSHMEGVDIRTTGPSGGAQVSIQGCDPKHVLVLINNQRINQAAEGSADIGGIPLDMIEKVEVYRGGESARFGSDALGGVINIVTHIQGESDGPELASAKSWGPWKTDGYTITATDPVPLSGLRTRFAYAFESTNGDFDYDYTVYPRPELVQAYSGTRLNAALRQENYFFSARGNPGPKTDLSFSGHLYDSRRGLPGGVSDIDSTARMEDSRYQGTALLNYHAHENLHLEWLAGLSRFRQYFDNRNHHLAAERYEDRFVTDNMTTRAAMKYLPRPDNRLQAGVEVRRTVLKHDDLLRPQFGMGRTTRNTIGVFLSDQQTIETNMFGLFHTLVVDAGLRWDNIRSVNTPAAPDSAEKKNHIDRLSEKIGISLSGGKVLTYVARASYGTSYRLPEMNALFWKGDIRSSGNADLKPEWSEHSDVGIEMAMTAPVDLRAGITYFHSFIKDLIVWQPGYQQVWKPVNLDAARITGHEEFIRLGLLDNHLQLDYRNTITVPRNRTFGSTAFNKSLTYRPHYVTTLEATAEYGILKTSYGVRLVDIRYAKDANTKWYDAYRIDTWSCRLARTFGKINGELTARVDNLLDENYVLIGHYPMPKSEWGIECAVTYQW